MNPLLLSGFGISIHVQRRRLVIGNRLRNERLEFYPHQIDHDSIVVDGHTGSITFEAMRWLMKHGIPITMLNWNGELVSITLPKEPKSGKLRVSQYGKYLDQETRFQIASEIVRQKVASTHNLLRELSRYYEEIDIGAADKRFEAEGKHFSNSAKTIANLLNYEGRVATFYWEQLANIFSKLYPAFHFKGRANKSYSWNMNASDEINALLNYGYSILESEVRKAINAVGLDPTIGFLHELAPSKTPLVYDIQELFRWLIDLSIIELLEQKKLKKSDFMTTENYHIRLTEKAAKSLLERISLSFNRKVSYKHGRNFTFQSVLLDTVQQLANFILDKRRDLKFNIPIVQIARNDFLDITGRITNMSPDERKNRGINKSTLWYQKKNLAAGKRITLYSKVFSKLA